MTLDINETVTGIIQNALREDLGHLGDITTNAICNRGQTTGARILTKSRGIIAGLDFAVETFYLVDRTLSIDKKVRDGAAVEQGTKLISIRGATSAILIAERTALNILGRLSGIATHTSRFVEKLAGSPTRILDTRKTTPGWRSLEKYAVRCGGGENHRMGLYDMFLIKENHIAEAGSITNAVKSCRDYAKKQGFQAKIEVETTNMKEVREAVDLKVDRIMLDNMAIRDIISCVAHVAGRIPLEVSGNVTLENVAEIARCGVDYISIGSITHSAPNLDVSLLL